MEVWWTSWRGGERTEGGESWDLESSGNARKGKMGDARPVAAIDSVAEFPNSTFCQLTCRGKEKRKAGIHDSPQSSASPNRISAGSLQVPGQSRAEGALHVPGVGRIELVEVGIAVGVADQVVVGEVPPSRPQASPIIRKFRRDLGSREVGGEREITDRKSTRLNSSHANI